jgi:putative transposase
MFTPRRRPAHGVLIDPDRPTIVFVTVCTKDREPWLATDANHRNLVDAWTAAEAWLVGRYMIMPDHLHLFAAPGAMGLGLDNWVRYWKRQFRQKCNDASQDWQDNHRDTRLRSWEDYDSKWEYVRLNPVRAGLVERSEDWPYQGELNKLPWW